MTDWRDTVRPLLERHYTKEMIDLGAVEVGLGMTNMVLATQRTLAGAPHPPDVAAMLNDFLFTLPANPFWQRHAPELVSIMRQSWTAFAGAAEHAAKAENALTSDDRDVHRMQMLKMREIAMVEMPVAVLAVMPSVDMHSRMADLRVALANCGEL